MVTIKFYGDLKRFGSQYDMKVSDVRQALGLVIGQIKGLKNYMRDRHFQVKIDGVELSNEMAPTLYVDSGELTDRSKVITFAHILASQIRYQFESYSLALGRAMSIAWAYYRGEVTLHITPKVTGGSGVLRVVAGALMIGLAFVNPMAGTFVGKALLSVGLALSISGVASLLMSPPKINVADEEERGSRSSGFSSIDNVAQDGGRIPIPYGKILCGSRVGSIDVSSERVDPDAEPSAPSGQVVELEKTYIKGEYAYSPSGKRYNTDANDPNVKARLYKVN